MQYRRTYIHVFINILDASNLKTAKAGVKRFDAFNVRQSFISTLKLNDRSLGASV